MIIGLTRHTGAVATFHGESHKDIEYEREKELMTQFVEDFGGTFPVAIERSRINFENYDVSFIPTLVLIDRKGKIQKVGHLYGVMLEEIVKRMLRE